MTQTWILDASEVKKISKENKKKLLNNNLYKARELIKDYILQMIKNGSSNCRINITDINSLNYDGVIETIISELKENGYHVLTDYSTNGFNQFLFIEWK